MSPIPKRFAIAVGALVSLAGCATAPIGPSVAVYPGAGKNFEEFRLDDAVCRQYAGDQIGGANAAQAANDNAVARGLIGTLIGAAAGGAIGGRQGAAVGAGAGLIVGSASGADATQHSSYGLQRRYDIGYQQCMYAKGNSIPAAIRRHPVYPPPGNALPSESYMPPPPNTPPPGH